MTIIHEIASRKIIPGVKGVLVHELYVKGFSQRKIAKVLGITQPQIHKYLSKPIEYYYSKLSQIGVDKDYVKHYIELLVYTISNREIGRFALMINSFINDLAMKYVCSTYEELREYCVEGRLSDPNIEYYREWLNHLSSRYRLEKLIPEVGSNIVYSPVKPRDLSDIIGLTGRIIKAGSSVKIAGEPVYGGSRHLSRILLLASKYEPSRRVAMNIRDVSDHVNVLRKTYVVLESGPHDSRELFWENVEEVLRDKPDILIDHGGYGLEPVTYIITNGFRELEDILKLLI